MSDANRTAKTVSCNCFHLKSHPSRHFVYEIHVIWSTGQSAVIYRRYSQFFNLQCSLLDLFPLEAGTYDPSRRTIPFLPGKKLVGNLSEKTAEKRRSKFDVYLKALITLPRVGVSELVIQFLESRESDLKPLIERERKSRAHQIPVAGHGITSPISYPQYVVIEDYTKAQSGELSVAAGTVLYIVEKKHTGWWLAQYGEFTGWVPASYLDPVYNPSDNEDEALSAVPALPCKYVTTSDYVAAEGDELSIARGCVVDVITKAIDGWWTCRYSGKEGFFPAAYLRKADSLKAKQLLEMNRQPSAIVASAPTNGLNERSQLSHYAPPRRDANKPKPPRPPLPAVMSVKSVEYVAIADFTNTMQDGINLVEGSRIKVLNKDDSGWWFVQTGGVKGWAPSTYMEPVKAPPLAMRADNTLVTRSPPPTRPRVPPKVTSSSSPGSQTASETSSGSRSMTSDAAKSSCRKSNLSVGGACKPAISPKPVALQNQEFSPSAHTNAVTEDQGAQLSVAELRRRLTSNFSK